MSENIQWYRWGSREKEQSTAQARLTGLRPARRAYEIFSRSGLGQRRAGTPGAGLKFRPVQCSSG